MNDIDRSVESMDFAMRRRFVFKEITAEESAKRMKLPPDNTVKRMEALNNAISRIEGLGSSYHIGGAYFLPKDEHGETIKDEQGNIVEPNYDELWNLRLAPLVKEYLRGTGFDKKLEELEKQDKQEGREPTFDLGVQNLMTIGTGE
jgi:hypothetical protein